MKTLKVNGMFNLVAVIFLCLSIVFSAFTLTGFTVLQNETKIQWIGAVFLIAGILSFIAGKFIKN